MNTRLRVLAAALAAAGCMGGQSAPDSVRVYKSRGVIQCASSGTPPQEMRRELIDAGIQVLSHACGTSGRMHAAVCGAPSDQINIFSIPAGQLEQAAALSFQPLSTLPQARETACP
jgi:hypothetical protein